MKTQVTKLAFTLLFFLSATLFTFAGAMDPQAKMISLSDGKLRFDQIEARGNVELYLMSGDSDKVELYDSYFHQNALVQVENGKLRITSYTAEKLKVWVTVYDLRKLTAYGQTVVRTLGKFTPLELSVNLFDQAYAGMNMDAINADIRLNGKARADIEGFALQSSQTVNYAATLNVSGFNSAEQYRQRIASPYKFFIRLPKGSVSAERFTALSTHSLDMRVN